MKSERSRDKSYRLDRRKAAAFSKRGGFLLSVIFSVAVGAAVSVLLRIGKHKLRGELMLGSGDAAGILAPKHVGELLGPVSYTHLDVYKRQVQYVPHLPLSKGGYQLSWLN